MLLTGAAGTSLYSTKSLLSCMTCLLAGSRLYLTRSPVLEGWRTLLVCEPAVCSCWDLLKLGIPGGAQECTRQSRGPFTPVGFGLRSAQMWRSWTVPRKRRDRLYRTIGNAAFFLELLFPISTASDIYSRGGAISSARSLLTPAASGTTFRAVGPRLLRPGTLQLLSGEPAFFYNGSLSQLPFT